MSATRQVSLTLVACGIASCGIVACGALADPSCDTAPAAGGVALDALLTAYDPGMTSLLQVSLSSSSGHEASGAAAGNVTSHAQALASFTVASTQAAASGSATAAASASLLADAVRNARKLAVPGAGPAHASPWRHVAKGAVPVHTAGKAKHAPIAGRSPQVGMSGVGAPGTATTALGPLAFDNKHLPYAASTMSPWSVFLHDRRALQVFLTFAGLVIMSVWGSSAVLRHKLAQSQPIKLSGYAMHTQRSAEDDKALGTWDATVATFSAVVGTGLLAMPYAFSLAGIIAGPVIVFFVCCSAYTTHLMAWTFNLTNLDAERQGLPASRRGWGFIVELAFGGHAKRGVNFLLVVELWGYLLSCMVVAAMNLCQVMAALSSTGAIAISVIIAYGMTFVPAKLLTRVNVFSNLVYIACCLMFLLTGIFLPERAPADDIVLVKPHGLLSAAGILVFGPAAHSFYPALMHRMKEPAKYPSCARRAYVAAGILYLATAVPGYLLFGNAVQPSAVMNIGCDLHMVPIPGLAWMNVAAAVGMFVKTTALQPLVLTPLTSTIEGMVANKGLLSDEWLKVIVTPITLFLSALAAAHFANEMGLLLNVIGCIFSMTIAFVVPVICYWRLTSKPLNWITKSIFVVLVAMGIAFATVGGLATLV